MDLWKYCQGKEIEIGGWKCPCCNPFGKRKTRHHNKTLLNKRTRKRILKLTKQEYLYGDKKCYKL